MRMGLDLIPQIRQELTCEVCGKSMEDHTPSECPVAGMEALAKARKTWNCPSCHRRDLEANFDDYFECRSCKIVWSRSAGKPDDVEIELILDLDENEAIQVYKLSDQGTGKFPYDLAMEQLSKLRDQMVTRKKTKRRTRKDKKCPACQGGYCLEHGQEES